MLQPDFLEANAWLLKLRLLFCRNLNDLETTECTSLSCILSLIRLRLISDSWSWILNSSLSFSIKPLFSRWIQLGWLSHMSNTSTPLSGKIFILRRLIFSSGSLVLVLSILQIISLTPFWCIICQCDGESPVIFFGSVWLVFDRIQFYL